MQAEEGCVEPGGRHAGQLHPGGVPGRAGLRLQRPHNQRIRLRRQLSQALRLPRL